MNGQMLSALAGFTVAIGGLLYLVVKLTIRAEINDAIARINGMYTRSQGSPLTGHEIETRLKRLEARHT